MNKFLLSIIAIISITSFSFSQIEMYVNGGSVDLSGDVYNINAWNGGEVHTEIIVVNSTGTDLQWVATRRRINEIPTWTDYMCWGQLGDPFGACYGASQMDTNPWTSPQSDIVTILAGDSGIFSNYTTPDYSASGTVTYRYYVGPDANNPMDSIDLVIGFTLGLDEVTPSLSVNIAPNPSNDYFVVSANGANASSIKVVDVLGNVILSEKMTTASKKIDVSSYRNGVYFVIIESDEAKPVTKRIVVRH